MNETHEKQILLAMADRRRAELCGQAMQALGLGVAHAKEATAPLSTLRKDGYALLVLDEACAADDPKGLQQLFGEMMKDAQTQVLWLCAKRGEAAAIGALNAGAAVALPEGADSDWIAAQAKALLAGRERRPASGAVLQVGALKIEAASRRVSLNGELIPLTTAEFDLLYFLASHPGRALSRDEIYQELRGILHNGLDRSLDLRIARLRKKLGDDGHNPHLILSIRGIGYQLAHDSE